jgi:hypothetical protein
MACSCPQTHLRRLALLPLQQGSGPISWVSHQQRRQNPQQLTQQVRQQRKAIHCFLCCWQLTLLTVPLGCCSQPWLQGCCCCLLCQQLLLVAAAAAPGVPVLQLVEMPPAAFHCHPAAVLALLYVAYSGAAGWCCCCWCGCQRHTHLLQWRQQLLLASALL